MYYRAYTKALEDEHKIVVDTTNCGAGVHVSHVPGNRTPIELKSDLSVEIALRLASHPLRKQYLDAAEMITNNHFDTDGVLATYTLMHPGEALAHQAAIIDACEAGDFYEIGSPQGVQFHHMVDSFLIPERSPLGSDLSGRSRPECNEICTNALLDELPGLLYAPERYLTAWQDPYQELMAQLKWARSGAVEVKEYLPERLSVIRTSQPFDDYGRNHLARGHRILEVIEDGNDTYYLLNYRVLLWYELISRSSSITHRLDGLAARLDDLETDDAGYWAITPWRPALRRVYTEPDADRCVPAEAPLCVSTLGVDQIVPMLRQTLHELDEAARRPPG